jgi:hypothetical protein
VVPWWSLERERAGIEGSEQTIMDETGLGLRHGWDKRAREAPLTSANLSTRCTERLYMRPQAVLRKPGSSHLHVWVTSFKDILR